MRSVVSHRSIARRAESATALECGDSRQKAAAPRGAPVAGRGKPNVSASSIVNSTYLKSADDSRPEGKRVRFNFGGVLGACIRERITAQLHQRHSSWRENWRRWFLMSRRT